MYFRLLILVTIIQSYDVEPMIQGNQKPVNMKEFRNKLVESGISAGLEIEVHTLKIDALWNQKVYEHSIVLNGLPIFVIEGEGFGDLEFIFAPCYSMRDYKRIEPYIKLVTTWQIQIEAEKLAIDGKIMLSALINRLTKNPSNYDDIELKLSNKMGREKIRITSTQITIKGPVWFHEFLRHKNLIITDDEVGKFIRKHDIPKDVDEYSEAINIDLGKQLEGNPNKSESKEAVWFLPKIGNFKCSKPLLMRWKGYKQSLCDWMTSNLKLNQPQSDFDVDSILVEYRKGHITQSLSTNQKIKTFMSKILPI